MEMSSESLDQPLMSSAYSEMPRNRSITDIIMTLRTSFFYREFRAAVTELMGREENLRREKDDIISGLRVKCDVLEGEFGDLELQSYRWEEERRLLTRDCELNDDKLKELERELSLVKEKEANAIKRYDRLRNELREMEEGKVKLLSDLRVEVEELKRKLREKEEEVEDKGAEFNAQLEELEEVKRNNLFLEEERLKYNARLEELQREQDERIKELLNKNVVEKSQIEAQLKARGVELEEAARKNACLEEQIKRLSDNLLHLERIKNDTVKEKDEKILQLMKDNKSLDVEKRKLEANLGEVKESFLKLEGDVVSSICLNLERDERFASTHVGKTISGILHVLDCEEIGNTWSAGATKDGSRQEADTAFISHANEPERCLKSGKQSLETVKRKLDFKEEFPRKDGAADNKNATPPVIIPIESDDDDENILHVSGVNNKQKCRVDVDEDDFDDNNWSLKHKKKKSEHAVSEQVKQEPLLFDLSGDRNDHKLNAEQRQTLTTIRKCGEKLMKEVGESRCILLEDNGSKGDGSKYNYGTPKSLNPKVDQYRTIHRQRQQNKVLVCWADMVCALDQDDDFCAKALCALYRHQKPLLSGTNCFNLEGSQGLEEAYFKRVAALAEFLIDGDPIGKMKKSVAELKQHDPEGLADCKKICMRYSNKLIDIYLKKDMKGDPLFAPSSSDLQYM